MKKINRLILILLCFFLFYNFCFSQDTTKNKPKIQHTIYGEFLGNSGLWYNVGYNCVLKIKDRHKISFSSGLQYFPYLSKIYDSDNNSKQTLAVSNFSFSPQISYLYGKSHNLEIGVGWVFDFQIDHIENHSNSFTWGIPLNIGYRYQKEDGGLFLKISWNPAYTEFYYIDLLKFTPFWGGASIGYTFKNKKL